MSMPKRRRLGVAWLLLGVLLGSTKVAGWFFFSPLVDRSEVALPDGNGDTGLGHSAFVNLVKQRFDQLQETMKALEQFGHVIPGDSRGAPVRVNRFDPADVKTTVKFPIASTVIGAMLRSDEAAKFFNKGEDAIVDALQDVGDAIVGFFTGKSKKEIEIERDEKREDFAWRADKYLGPGVAGVLVSDINRIFRYHSKQVACLYSQTN